MKILNSVGCSIHLWGTPLVTGLQLDFILLITTLRAQLFKQFSIHLTVQPIHQHLLYEDLMPDSVESLTEAKVDDIHCSPPFVYQVSHFIIKV